MIKYSRKCILDIFDYSGNKLCNLYDNSIDSAGQAYDIFVKTERNGWRELSFNIPSTEGNVDNYRLDFIKPDFKLRLITDEGADWFLITQPTQSHKGKRKDYSIKAGHISQLLKTKKLDLEFSDTEGNNVGTPKEFLDYILEGTGWTSGLVDTFYEEIDDYDAESYHSYDDDFNVVWTSNTDYAQFTGVGRTKQEALEDLDAELDYLGLTRSDGRINYRAIKRRSLKANAKTGAFKLIASMCDLFDAKPVYHGDTKTVDIIPINPFSAPIDGSLPDVTKADGVIELQYSSNVKNVTRTMNSDNVITKLYAYGSYGDTTYGYCGIDECSHTEHIFTLNSSLSVGRYYKFTISDDSGTLITRRFKVDTAIPSGSEVYYSMLDPTSQMYVWVEVPSSSSTFGNNHTLYWEDISNEDWNKITSKINTKGKAYILEANSDGYDLPYNKSTGYQTIFVKNWFSYVTDFEYFQEVGLLSDINLQKLAGYQRYAKTFYQIVHDKSLQLSDSLLDLSETIGEVNFCKLSIAQASTASGCLKLKLNKTTDYPDGIIYRSDDETTKKTKFVFNTTPTIKGNGDAATSGASLLYIIHNNNPVTWDTAYLKAVDNEDNPTYLTFHTDKDVNINSDKFFLFQSNNVNGNLGSLQVSDESTLRSINGQLKTVTISHDIQFYPNESSIPSNVTLISDNTHNDDPDWYKIDEFAFAWDYGASQLYFCYYDHYGINSEREFRKVYFQNSQPSASDLSYWYDWSMSTLYRGSGSVWTPIKEKNEIPVTSKFGAVYKACKEREKYYKGVPEFYSYYASSSLAAGNYYIENDYGDMYVFTLQQALPSNSTIRLNSNKKVIETFSGRTFSPAILHSALTAELGTINTSTGEPMYDDSKCRSASYIAVTAGQDYTFEGFTAAIPLTICKYKYGNGQYEFVEAVTNVSGYDGIISIESGITHIKILCNVDYRTFNSYSNFCAYRGQVKNIECKAYRFDNVRYYQSNEYTTTAEPGSIDLDTFEVLNGQLKYHTDDGYLNDNNEWVEGSFDIVTCDYDKDYCRSAGYLPVIPSSSYYIHYMVVIDSNNVGRWCTMHAVFYDSKKNPVSVARNVSNSNSLTIPYNAYFIRFVTLKPSDHVLQENETFADVFNYFVDYRHEAYVPFQFYNTRAGNSIIIEDKDYVKINTTSSGESEGINYLMKHFVDVADLSYLTYQPELKDAQNALDNFSTNVAVSLGDMYREGYWQKTDYVDGDEKKLYKDAVDTIKKISRPTASYSIDYLDLYDSNKDMQYSVHEDTDISWPDLSIMSAAHLIDDEISVSCWAYIDVINKCYDKPWKTQINIDTEMSTMAQHTFADVIANIADVANSIKAKDTIIDRATALHKDGTFYTSKLQGAIDAANLRIFGGKTKWYTNENGQLVFESEDGSSAMILTGTGLAVSSHKDVNGNFVFRTCITGYGITADEITTGHLNVDRIEAGMITVDKLVSTAGLELDISKNQAIKLVTNNIKGIDGRLTNAEFSIQPDQIRSVVQTISTLDNFYTKSEINQQSDAITLRVDSNEDDIDALATRMNSAELKITDSAIISTVTSSTTYTNDVNGLKNRMSTAEQKITDSAIISTVTSSTKYTNDINGLKDRLSTAELKITDSAIVSTVTSSTKYNNDINGLKDRVSTAELKITDSAIISTVRSSTAYNNDLAAKASANDVSNLQTRMNTAEQKITDSAIRSTVSSMFDNYYTKSQVDQTANSIEMTVSDNYLEKSSPSVGVSTSSLTINSNGISMTGGTISLTSGSNMSIKSGGSVVIEALNGSESYISLGESNFYVSTTGNLFAVSGRFQDDLYVNNKKVLTADDVGQVINYNIIVSGTKPSGHSILWFQPTTSGGQGVDIVESTQSFYSQQDANQIYTLASNVANESFGDSDSTLYRKIMLTATSTPFVMTGNNFSYNVSFNVQAQDVSTNPSYFEQEINVYLKNRTSGTTINLGTQKQIIYKSKWVTYQFTAKLSTNILTDGSYNIDLIFFSGKSSIDNYNASNFRRGWYRVACTPLSCTVSSMKSSQSSGSSTELPCNVYYIE